MQDIKWDSLTQLVIVAGAAGTAAMGVIESFKWTRLGIKGLNVTIRCLPAPSLDALKRVYGAESFDALLEGSWRKGAAEFERTLSTGLRLAVFSAEDVEKFVASFGDPDPASFAAAIELLRSVSSAPFDGSAPFKETSEMIKARDRLARLESVIDARVKAAVAAGRDSYVHTMQGWAAGLALSGCLITAIVLTIGAGGKGVESLWLKAVFVGLLAVPLAPVAKDDVVSFLNSLRDVFQKKKPVSG